MKKVIITLLIISIIILFPWILTWFKLDINIYVSVISYSGAILGGLLTLVGVYITIENSKKERNEELELQYSPVLVLDVVKNRETVGENKEIIVLFNNTNFDDSSLEYIDHFIKISNVGRGEIRNLRLELKDLEVVHSSIPIGKKDVAFYILNENPIQFLPIDGNIYLHIAVPKLAKSIDEDINSMILKITLDFNFMGIFNKKDYNYELDFCLYTNYKKDKRNEYYIHSTHLFLK